MAIISLTLSLSLPFSTVVKLHQLEGGGPLFNLVKCLLSAAFEIRRHLADAHDIASFEVAFSRFFMAAARAGEVVVERGGGSVVGHIHSNQTLDTDIAFVGSLPSQARLG